MPKLTSSVPKYRKHRASGQAVVTIGGKDFYLGPHGTKASKLEYDRLVPEWLVAGRPVQHPARMEPKRLTVKELISQYWKSARKYYQRDGESTGTAERLRPVLRLVREIYGDKPVSDFGPLALESLRHRMIALGQARVTPMSWANIDAWEIEDPYDACQEGKQAFDSFLKQRGRCSPRVGCRPETTRRCEPASAAACCSCPGLNHRRTPTAESVSIEGHRCWRLHSPSRRCGW